MEIERITLPWANMLRERNSIPRFRLNHIVQEYLEPILRYADSEEARLNLSFAKELKIINDAKAQKRQKGQ